MKTSYSRSFITAASILLLALIILGASFQLQVNEYMESSTISSLRQDAKVVADLASAYSQEGHLTSRNFLLNLDIIAEVTDADVLICNQDGFIVLCSDALTGCDHEGVQFNEDYIQKVIRNDGDVATGTIRGLYSEQRFVVSTPIYGPNGAAGIVVVSTPTAATTMILNRISNIFLTASLFVVLLSVLAVSAFARRESRPLRDMARTANAFGHGNLEARVRLEDDYS